MRLVFGILFSMLAVFLNCIELNSQRINQRLVEGEILPYNQLPHPFHYDANGQIRVNDLPNAEPIIRGELLIGFWNNGEFFGITQGDQLFVMNLQEHRILQRTHTQIFTLLHGHPPP